MRIFVLGSTGMLGHVLKRYFMERAYHVVGITREDINACNRVDQIDWEVRKWCQQPDDVAINCMGVVPQVESSFGIEYEVNAVFPHKLVRCFNGRIIHVSTNCVFSGTERRAYSSTGYTEYDLPRPGKSYGITKLQGEIPLHGMVLRTSIIGPQIHGTYGFYDKVRRGAISHGYVNHYWNGVTTLQLAKTIDWIIDKGQFKHGVYHIHSPNTVSKFDLLREILHVENSRWEITPVLADHTDLTLWSFQQNVNHPNIDCTIQSQLKELHKWY